MSDPKRWSDSSSEADPVLQSVLRYAQDVQPSPAQVSALLERLNAAPTEGARFSRRAFPWKAAAAGFVVATGAAASYGLLAPASAPRAIVTTEVVRPPTAREMTPQPDLPRKAPEIEHSEPLERSVPQVPASRAKPVSPPSVPTVELNTPEVESSADTEGVGLLQEARRHVASAPSRTLALTEQHGTSYPKSLLREEREALRVQALFRLHRISEAEAALERFESAYPSSPYRRQLRNERPAATTGGE